MRAPFVAFVALMLSFALPLVGVASAPVRSAFIDSPLAGATFTPTPTPAPLSGSVNVRLTPTTVGTITPGQTLSVDVVVENQQPIAGYQFGIGDMSGNPGFDPTIVQVVSIAEGPYLSDWAYQNGGFTISAG